MPALFGWELRLGPEKKWLLSDSGLMADLCNYTSEIDMDARMLGANTGGEHKVRPYAPPERRGESCIRLLCLIRPYAQKLRLHRAMLYAFRRSTRNRIRAKKQRQRLHTSLHQHIGRPMAGLAFSLILVLDPGQARHVQGLGRGLAGFR
uniref:Uncharacterized protein n=1 Tax=Candidatus Kentrum sp. FM TaxID=2126340 RepID=A0A450SBF0_9GAMM|nr:MAG: hypothetical protein BECKFM1743A_GA0114220_100725 [Candidatus Kentron sp. FM]VFJ57860.1 MAG: hypothetical protein BECKFM1743C_GA0114222_102102 [Candidatus Kentron sp. FM]VFK06082.1 MAG: hypothetical protein BECKFM1743B_GA0114221_100105 [Candidatus Kentron sp. FM]